MIDCDGVGCFHLFDKVQKLRSRAGRRMRIRDQAHEVFNQLFSWIIWDTFTTYFVGRLVCIESFFTYISNTHVVYENLLVQSLMFKVNPNDDSS